MASESPQNVLGADNLARIVIASLPKSEQPQIRNPWDAISLLCHACMLAVDFRLVGLGEDHRIEAASQGENPSPLPAEWNTLSASDYAFKYKHTQSSMEYLLKVSKLGGKAVIHGLGIGDDKVASLDVAVKEFVSESSLPFTARGEITASESLSSLQGVFITAGRIGDFSALVKIQLLQKLIPGLQKNGYQDSAEAASERHREIEQRRDVTAVLERRPTYIPPQDEMPPLAQPHPLADPLIAPPRRPYGGPDFEPPGFEDEHGVLRPPGGGARQPMNIGERDLYPPGLGPHDPLRIGGPHGGFRGGGGGMHPTFDDPMFGGRGNTGGGYDPMAPPGARYDPVGPYRGRRRGNPGGNRGGGFGGDFGGGFGGPPNPFGGFGNGDFI